MVNYAVFLLKSASTDNCVFVFACVCVDDDNNSIGWEVLNNIFLCKVTTDFFCFAPNLTILREFLNNQLDR